VVVCGISLVLQSLVVPCSLEQVTEADPIGDEVYRFWYRSAKSNSSEHVKGSYGGVIMLL